MTTLELCNPQTGLGEAVVIIIITTMMTTMIITNAD
jgi:hypothetical protein